MTPYGIHWFRRDLRVAGNQALEFQMEKFEGRVVGLFTFDHKFLSRPDFSVNRFQFFLESLFELSKELRAIGSDLLVLDIGPIEAFNFILDELDRQGIDRPQLISWSRDYEPFAVARDKKMIKIFGEKGIQSADFRDHLVVEPHELKKSDGSPYQVYSPFARCWNGLMEGGLDSRIKEMSKAIAYLESVKKEKKYKLTWQKIFSGKDKPHDYLQEYLEKNKKSVDVEIPKAGSIEAYKKAKDFTEKVKNYHLNRDFPEIDGTSQLSPYLKNGSITSSLLLHLVKYKPFKKKESGIDTYCSELIWREFYYHILSHFPRVETKSFQTQFEDIKWENNKKFFELWKEGKTGFPIVDAGMRQLKTTGWMHNRVRMIVASFLTKDLLISWRWGERYFMRTLLDGDLAPNNGGWQWAASTGCDPQPYFRIFNPWLQSKKFDPEGRYIKKYLPELKHLPAKKLHEPIIDHPSYPNPIVDHKKMREKALSLYKRS